VSRTRRHPSTRAPDQLSTLLSPLATGDWGEAVAYLRDPDGHVLAIVSARS
jgi:uncharacterized glyoxalase superfamily protein PhnB